MNIKLVGNSGGKKAADAAKRPSAKQQPQKTESVRANERRAQESKPARSRAAKAEKVEIKVRSSSGAKRNNGKGLAIALTCVVVMLALLAGGTCLLAEKVDKLNTIYPNVSISAGDNVKSLNVGGMTIAEAVETLNNEGYGVGEKSVTVELPMDAEIVITAEDAGISEDAGEAAKLAYAQGRDGGKIQNLLSWLKCRFKGVEVVAGTASEIDTETVMAKIKAVTDPLASELTDSEIEITDSEITIVKGADSVQFDNDDIYSRVIAALEAGESEISYEPETQAAEDFDFDKLYDEVYCEPISAAYDSDTGTVTEGENGVSFDIDEAKRMWDDAAQGDTVVIPLIITEPEVTSEDLSGSLFADCLAEKSTSLSGSSAARINNITKAAASMNGIVLNPGDEFSYNKALGQRTAANGYQAAGAYSNGQVVSEIGGGICQGSSTLYYCVLLSNLEVVERHCHYFGVSYLPAGLDATVSWSSPDFRFKNNRDYPIKIEAYTDTSSYTLVVKIWGTDVDGSYVKMTTEQWNTSDGYGVQSYRNVYDKNGNLLSTTKESTSQYHYHVTATEKPAESAAPTEEPITTDTPVTTDTPITTDAPVTTDTPIVTDAPVITDPPAPVDPVGGGEAVTEGGE